MSIESVTPSNHIIHCRPSPTAFNHSQHQGLLKWVNTSHPWPKYWSFSFSISPSVNIQDWFPLGLTGWIYLMSKGLKSLVQHHSSKTSIWHSGFFLVQLSHAYMTMRKTKALTRCTFVCKVMSLPFNMLYRLFIIFSSKEQASFNFMATVTICSDFGAPQNKVSHGFHCFPIYFPWSDGTRCHGLSFWMLSFKPSFFTLLFYIHQEAL